MLEHLPKVIRDRSGRVIFEASRENLSEAILVNADLRAANLEGVVLVGVDLRGADLRGADLYWAALGLANLERADLRGACLRGAGLSEVNLQRAKLQGADFGPDNLGCATDLTKADTRGAEYDATTVLPDGFAPDVAGMVWSDGS